MSKPSTSVTWAGTMGDMHIVLAAKPGADQSWVADAAIDLARQTGASVAVVAVDQVELERLSPVPRSVQQGRAGEAASAAMQRLAGAGVEVTRAVLPGRPVERIIEFADSEQADLILVGSSGRPAVAQRLLGSVPLELIKKSVRPVLVITHPQHA